MQAFSTESKEELLKRKEEALQEFAKNSLIDEEDVLNEIEAMLDKQN
ncbi:MAG: hypothetical protein H7A25_17825 [Leptospiraceae bacterium]|nr:hypothetical protein [Leptospiraceae bacterium]MCP5501767.1 hypothetical protein [Leptospiraceae bacterium]